MHGSLRPKCREPTQYQTNQWFAVIIICISESESDFSNLYRYSNANHDYRLDPNVKIRKIQNLN